MEPLTIRVFFCRVGGIIFLAHNASFSFKAGLGFGTNNFVELLVLWLLLRLARIKDLDKLIVHGDSMIVINSLNKVWNYHILLLQALLEGVQSLA